MRTTIDYKFLRLIPNPKFNLWDVKRYNASSSLKFDNVIRLSDILTPYKKAVSKDEMRRNKWKIIAKINFGGQLFLRSFEEINRYKGNLNLVPENAIIYSKINVRHGCIYYNEKGNTPFGVSSEYPTFTFDEIKVNGFFLKKVLRSVEFKKLLNTKTSGISKARVKQDEFLDIEIPLPTLSEQETIIKAYQYKIQQAQNLEQRAQDLEEEIEKYLYDSLGIVYEKKEKTYGLKFINYTEVQEWGIDKLISKSGFSSKKYKNISLSTYPNLVNDVFRGKSPKYSSTSEKVILNQKCNRWNDLDLTFVKTVEEKWFEKIDSKFLTKEGDILINSTGEGTIGRSTYIKKEFENLLYDSHLLLLRIDENQFNPKLFVELFNSSFGQSQIEEIKSAQATKQTELGVGNLLKICIPFISDIELQDQIVNRINDLKIQIFSNKTNSEELKLQAEQEFEQAIFS